MTTQSLTLAEALPLEIKRCLELTEIYKTIPTGRFGAMIRRDVDAAIKASAEGDTVGMLRAYEALRECK